MSQAVIVVALVWVAAAGTAVVLTRDPLRQAFTAGFFGLALAFLYLSLQAGDVALSQIVVGAIALPLIVLLSLAKVRKGPGVSRRARLVFFAVAAAGLAATLGVGLAGLPSFGAQLSAYARMLNELAPQQRHVTDVVSAIGFDYRGIDTLFEEFILLSAVASISVLLRPLSDETRRLPEDKAPDRTIPPPSPAVWLLAVFLSSLLLLTGLETVTHGQLTPGGGFQGGVILASGLYVVYLGTNYATVERFQPDALLESSDGLGAFGYVVIGLLGLLAGASFLSNVVNLGITGDAVSSGTIQLLNVVVGVEVFGGFAILASEFLDQTAVVRTRQR